MRLLLGTPGPRLYARPARNRNQKYIVRKPRIEMPISVPNRKTCTEPRIPVVTLPSGSAVAVIPTTQSGGTRPSPTSRSPYQQLFLARFRACDGTDCRPGEERRL